jgi:hypothetical protein
MEGALLLVKMRPVAPVYSRHEVNSLCPDVRLQEYNLPAAWFKKPGKTVVPIGIIMKFLFVLLCSFILTACGGGGEPPVANIQASSPAPARNASQVSGSGEVAIHLYQALYGKAPSNAMLTQYMKEIGISNGFAWAASMVTDFNTLSDSDLSTLVLNNIGITPTSLKATALFGTSQQAYDNLQNALRWYFDATGVASRGTVIIQLADIVSHFEGETTFGVYGNAATIFNRQVAANFAYSSSSASLDPAAVSTASANAGVTQNVKTGALVTLDGSASTADAGKTLSYAWALSTRPAGSSAGLSSLTSVKPTFTPDLAGTYVATLIVNDGVANSKAATVSIVAVVNVAPVANAGAAQNVVTGAVVILDGSASSDADGDTLTYAWTLTSRPAGSSAVLSSWTSAKTTFTADVTGAYVASLMVNDGKVSSDLALVTVTASTALSTPVVSSVSIDGGAASTTSKMVTVQFAVHDSVGVTGYLIDIRPTKYCFATMVDYTMGSAPSVSDERWVSVSWTLSLVKTVTAILPMVDEYFDENYCARVYAKNADGVVSSTTSKWGGGSEFPVKINTSTDYDGILYIGLINSCISPATWQNGQCIAPLPAVWWDANAYIMHRSSGSFNITHEVKIPKLVLYTDGTWSAVGVSAKETYNGGSSGGYVEEDTLSLSGNWTATGSGSSYILTCTGMGTGSYSQAFTTGALYKGSLLVKNFVFKYYGDGIVSRVVFSGDGIKAVSFDTNVSTKDWSFEIRGN